jgi:hypothetical protein
MTTHQTDLQRCQREQQLAADALRAGGDPLGALMGLADWTIERELILEAQADDAWFDEALIRAEADGTPDDVLVCGDLGGVE